MSIQDVKAHYETALMLKQDATGFFSEFQDKGRKRISAIQLDPDLSAEGKKKKMDSEREKIGKELIEWSKGLKGGFEQEMTRAKVKAESILEQPIKKPLDKEIAKFEKSLKQLKTEIMLIADPKKAKEAFESFARELKDPYYLDKVYEDYASIISPIVSEATGTERAKFKHDLLSLYSDIKERTLTDEQKEATKILNSADGYLQSNFYSPLVAQKVTELADKQYTDYLEKPNLFEVTDGGGEDE